MSVAIGVTVLFGRRKLVALCWMGSVVRDVPYVHLYPGMDIHVIVVVSNSIFLAGCTSVHLYMGYVSMCINVQWNSSIVDTLEDLVKCPV